MTEQQTLIPMEEVKEVKKRSKVKSSYGEYGNVMLNRQKMWSIAQEYGGIAVPYSPVKDTRIYEVILPTANHERQCCIYVKGKEEAVDSDMLDRHMHRISERCYKVRSESELRQVLVAL